MILAIDSESKNKYFRKRERGGVIYKITNIKDGKFYIGSTANLYKRYYTHIHDIRIGKNTCVRLIRAVKKHGEENFKFEIISTCPKEYVLKLEQWFIDNLNPDYNVCKIAGSNLGTKRTEEQKLVKSICQKDKWKNEEYRKKHLESLSKNWRKGSSHKMAKLNEEKALLIKKHLLQGKGQTEIAKEMNVSYYCVHDIARGKTWKNVKVEFEQ